MIFWLFAIVGVLLILAASTTTGTLTAIGESLGLSLAGKEDSTVGQFTISALADAIQVFEGFYPGSRAYRNNNPGNLEYHNQPGTTGADLQNRQPPGYAIFATYEAGRTALEALIRLRIAQHSAWTLLDFFYSYAPPSDNNDPDGYASTVARLVGVSPDTKLELFG
jgi:hypothetical protein